MGVFDRNWADILHDIVNDPNPVERAKAEMKAVTEMRIKVFLTLVVMIIVGGIVIKIWEKTTG